MDKKLEDEHIMTWDISETIKHAKEMAIREKGFFDDKERERELNRVRKQVKHVLSMIEANRIKGFVTVS